MGKKNPAIDTFINKSAPFAKPILKHIRQVVHKTCPGVEEKIKWSFPHFDYKGEMMCAMAAFKQHCAFGFWKAKLLSDPKGILNEIGEDGMGHLGRITSVKDLPADSVFAGFIKQAMKLNEQGIKLPARAKPAEKKELKVPSYFSAALNKNKKAKTVFDNASYSFRKEYVMWVTEAKTEETRNSRMATTLEWMAEGKGRNWKYERKK